MKKKIKANIDKQKEFMSEDNKAEANKPIYITHM
jgi:hypothetical protein